MGGIELKEYKWLQLDVNSYHTYQSKGETLPFSEYLVKEIQDTEGDGWHLHTYQVAWDGNLGYFHHFFLFDREKA
jgi:hypothetical protein